ncbi:MAG: right-handed parallel beta-helix repeat-containing protein, partial [Planctomycetota bacterium]
MERGIRVSSFLGAILLCACTAHGADLHVPGVYGTIQAAVDAAGTGDRVIIAEGYYSGAGNRDLDFGGRAITVQSDNPEDWGVVAGTVIDCENSGRGFYFQSGETSTSIVAGLTIANGYAAYGGGIRCVGSSPTIRNCIISDSSADDGGGMENEGSSAVITSCIFTGNSTAFGSGGGVCNYDCAGLEITNCIFYGNSAFWGGAIADGNSSPAIVNCTFTGNSADSGGGIANFFGGNPTISNCILWGDSATTGPEIYGDCVVSYCDVQGGHPGTGNIDADPLFVDAPSGNYHLSSMESPCFDAGDPAYSPAPGETDIDG